MSQNNDVIVAPHGYEAQEWESVKVSLNQAFCANLLPDHIKRFEDACVIALKGRELRLPPLFSMQVLCLINGKPGMEAKCMLALLNRDRPDLKGKWKWITEKDKRHFEAGLSSEYGDFWFSLDDAVTAGLMRKSEDKYTPSPGKQHTWGKYPVDMLKNRCVSQFVRFVAPEVIMGCYLPDELESIPEKTKATEVAEILEIEDNGE